MPVLADSDDEGEGLQSGAKGPKDHANLPVYPQEQLHGEEEDEEAFLNRMIGQGEGGAEGANGKQDDFEEDSGDEEDERDAVAAAADEVDGYDGAGGAANKRQTDRAAAQAVHEFLRREAKRMRFMGPEETGEEVEAGEYEAGGSFAPILEKVKARKALLGQSAPMERRQERKKEQAQAVLMSVAEETEDALPDGDDDVIILPPSTDHNCDRQQDQHGGENEEEEEEEEEEVIDGDAHDCELDEEEEEGDGNDEKEQVDYGMEEGDNEGPAISEEEEEEEEEKASEEEVGAIGHEEGGEEGKVIADGDDDDDNDEGINGRAYDDGEVEDEMGIDEGQKEAAKARVRKMFGRGAEQEMGNEVEEEAEMSEDGGHTDDEEDNKRNENPREEEEMVEEVAEADVDEETGRQQERKADLHARWQEEKEEREMEAMMEAYRSGFAKARRGRRRGALGGEEDLDWQRTRRADDGDDSDGVEEDGGDSLLAPIRERMAGEEVVVEEGEEGENTNVSRRPSRPHLNLSAADSQMLAMVQAGEMGGARNQPSLGRFSSLAFPQGRSSTKAFFGREAKGALPEGKSFFPASTPTHWREAGEQAHDTPHRPQGVASTLFKRMRQASSSHSTTSSSAHDPTDAFSLVRGLTRT